MAKADADVLCTECGLCCDGTLYGSVLIAPDERTRLGRVGLRVIQTDETLAMPQPCTALGGCLCSVYADRPAACAAYECTLRQCLVRGECTLDEARSKIAAIRGLIATIRQGFECPPSTSIWERILSLRSLPRRKPPSSLAISRARSRLWGPSWTTYGPT